MVMAPVGQPLAAWRTFSRSSSPGCLVEDVEEPVVPHLEHLGGDAHADGVAGALVVVDNNLHVMPPELGEPARVYRSPGSPGRQPQPSMADGDPVGVRTLPH